MSKTGHRFTLAITLGAAMLAGCTPFPDVGGSASEAALAQPYPDLVPLDGLDMRLETSRIAPETLPGIEARVSDLEARADRLRGAVVDPGTRRRMERGVVQ